ncbi:MAG: hypothetical protein PHY55_07645 [Bacteroidales bacterium]|nr:hypothetical protein [Bacteroidales bacterium]
MISFTAAIILLILGYIFYGVFVEKVFGANNEIQSPYISEFFLDINLKQCGCFAKTMPLFAQNNAVVLYKQCHCFVFLSRLFLSK